MAHRSLAAIGLTLLLTLALCSVGLAQRNGQQTRTPSYVVVIQVGPAAPAPSQQAPQQMTGAPAEEVAPEEMIIEPGEADMLAASDEDADEAVDEDAEEMEEGIDEDAEEMEEATEEDTGEEVVSTPDQGTEPETPEIVAPAPLPAPSTSLPPTDEGQLANHRVQINIADPALGALVTDRVPTITVTMRNVSSGETRTLANMVPTNDVLAGPSEWRFANDLYLPDGSYTMTVEINGERALFERVVVPNNSATAPAPGFYENR